MDQAATINLISGTQREEVWASTETFPFKFSTSVNVLIMTTGNKTQTSTHIQLFFFVWLDHQHNEAKGRRRVYSHSAGIRLDSPASIF